MALNFCVIFALMVAVCYSESNVPVFLWSHSKANKLESVAVPLAGHSLSSRDFLEGYLQQLSTNANVAVFLQDSLSLDDITTYANIYNDPHKETVFKSLKNVMGTYDSLHIPKVRSAHDAVSDLGKSFAGHVQHYVVTSSKDLDKIQLQPDQHNMLIFDLKPGMTGSHAVDLTNSDELMGKITKQLAAQSEDFVAVYTGNQPSKVDDSRMYYGRHLLAADDAGNETLLDYGPGCFYLYATKIGVKDAQGSESFLPSAKIKVDDSKCATSDNFTAKFSYAQADLDKGSNFSKFDLSMSVSIHTDGYWYVDNWFIDLQQKSGGQAETVHLQPKNQTLFGVANRSYFCGNEFVKAKRNSTNKDQAMTISGAVFQDLQMQFHIKNNTFETKYFVNTCEGFFTIPILSSLLVLLLLSLIAMLGVCMLSVMKTMDRFDDPRGKPLQINVAE